MEPIVYIKEEVGKHPQLGMFGMLHQSFCPYGGKVYSLLLEN